MFSVCKLTVSDLKPSWVAIHTITAYDGHQINMIDEYFSTQEECQAYVDKKNMEVYGNVQPN